MANKNKLKPKGHLYISSPTLESLVLLCENAKEAAHISGIEYSNFLKACKMEKDIRFSTYRKCAAGLGKEVHFCLTTYNLSNQELLFHDALNWYCSS